MPSELRVSSCFVEVRQAGQARQAICLAHLAVVAAAGGCPYMRTALVHIQIGEVVRVSKSRR
jgi:hypothetical protein